MEEEIKMKVCTKCGVEKNINQFCGNKNHSDGLQYWCKQCFYEIRSGYSWEMKYIERNLLISKKVGFKICRKCKRELPLEKFNRAYKKKSGYQIVCKECEKEYRRNNKERVREVNKKWCEENVDYIKLCSKNYRVENKEYLNERCRKYYREHQEELTAAKREYSSTRREEFAAWQREYRKTPQSKLNDSKAKNKRRKYGDLVEDTLTLKQWEIILYDQQHNLCDECKKEFNKKRIPTKDHILPLSSPWRVGLTFGNTRALCVSCNSKKHDHMYFMRGVYELLVTDI